MKVNNAAITLISITNNIIAASSGLSLCYYALLHSPPLFG
jgi:hypothetical protein